MGLLSGEDVLRKSVVAFMSEDIRCKRTDEKCDYDTAYLWQLVVTVLKSTLRSLGTGIAGMDISETKHE